MPRKIRDRVEADRCLDALEDSGLPLTAWAHAHDIDARSLHCWRLNTRRRRRSAHVVELVPTTPVAETARYLIRLDDIELEVGDDFRDDTLVRLLRVIAC
jgi:hypothetical protein